MKTTLDRTKSFGTITGHATAAYSQDGHLFDGSGYLITEDADKRMPVLIAKGIRAPDSLENAKMFLTNILADGPVAKSTVFEVAEKNNQPWDQITLAFNTLGLQSYAAPKNRAMMWRLPELV